MGKRILFSPIGGTDPIKYYRDGSMLHISRNYLPDVVYLYMSREMLQNHRKDNRYVDSLQRLGKLKNHNFEVHIIEREELVDVQQYDTFYMDFRNIIQEIEKTMGQEDELIINMASGTPAMKSALLILATLAEYRFQPVQVGTPLKRLNSDYEERKDYDVELFWELDEDNEEDAINRCQEIQCMNLMKLLKIDMIKKHIGAYDYTAALQIGKEIQDDISEEAYNLLEIADARIKLNRGLIDRLNKQKKFDIFPVSSGKEQKLFEYALVLQMKVKREEYADFIRGITPLVVDLFECILEEKCKLKLKDLCTENTKHILCWDRSKLEEAGLLEVFENEYKKQGGFKLGAVYSLHIATLIEYESRDLATISKVNEMVQIEQKVRNVAAHEIVSVTDEWFKKNTGKSANEIMKLIKDLFRLAGVRAQKDDWDSYDIMNQKINKELF